MVITNMTEYKHKYYLKNKEKILYQSKIRYKNNRKKILKNKKNYYQKNKEKISKRQHNYYLNNINKVRLNNKKWLQQNPEKAAAIDAKSKAKRKRSLGYEKIISDKFNEKIEWHHINNTNIIAIPQDLHRLYYGKYHRENTLIILKQLYPEVKTW